MSTEEKNPSSASGCLGIALFGVAAAVVLLITGPGMLAMAYLNPEWHLHFDTGQMWAFAGAISVVLWIFICLLTMSFRRGTIAYLTIAALAVGVFWFCHFGLKTHFTNAALDLYFPPQKEPPTSQGMLK